MNLNAAAREGVWFHVIFFALAGPALVLSKGNDLGRALLLLAMGYNVLLPALAFVRRQPEWLSLWFFLLPLSMAQVLPDLALASVAKVLVFPDLGQPRIGGEVPIYFMGMWMMLLFPIVLLANASRNKYTNAAVMAFILFVFWEWAARPLNIWYAQGVKESYGVALYVILPEILLVLGTLFMYRLTGEKGMLARVFGALSVPVFYAGSLFISLALIG